MTTKAATRKTDNWPEVREQAESLLTPEIVSLIKECMKDPHSDSRLISVLHKVQEEFGYLDTQRLDAVAQLLQVPAAKVSGVATFYHFFRLQPVGQFAISVCMGTACYVKGAERVAQRFKDELGIEYGDTTGDNMFSLYESRCLGTCGLAPVVMVNEDIHGQVTPDQVPALLEQYRSRAKQ